MALVFGYRITRVQVNMARQNSGAKIHQNVLIRNEPQKKVFASLLLVLLRDLILLTINDNELMLKICSL